MPQKYIQKRNESYGDTPEMPIDWSLKDRENLPGKRVMYFKDPETDLISPAPPRQFCEFERYGSCYTFYNTPQRRKTYMWDISHRNAVGLGCNEETPPFQNIMEEDVLNTFDSTINYHPWCREFGFKKYARQRGLFWHWIRYFSVITASRLDTILYNGYFKNEEIPIWDVVLARNHLFKILTCQIPQETVVFTNNIEEDHLWRGVYGEDFAKRSLIEKSHLDPKPVILEVGSIPIPGYRWIRVSLDGIDAVRGINYEMKSPRPLLWMFDNNNKMNSDQYMRLLDFQSAHTPSFAFTNPALEEFRMQTDFLVMDAMEHGEGSYDELYGKIDRYTFGMVPFAEFGKRKRGFEPRGYYWTEEKQTGDLGYYFYQANVQDQIGVDATELVKWDCLTDTIKATRIKRRAILYDVAVELQKFWDQVHAYRVKHGITFKDFYRINHLETLGEELYDAFY